MLGCRRVGFWLLSCGWAPWAELSSRASCIMKATLSGPARTGEGARWGAAVLVVLEGQPRVGRPRGHPSTKRGTWREVKEEQPGSEEAEGRLAGPQRPGSGYSRGPLPQKSLLWGRSLRGGRTHSRHIQQIRLSTSGLGPGGDISPAPHSGVACPSTSAAIAAAPIPGQAGGLGKAPPNRQPGLEGQADVETGQRSRSLLVSEVQAQTCGQQRPEGRQGKGS